MRVGFARDERPDAVARERRSREDVGRDEDPVLVVLRAAAWLAVALRSPGLPHCATADAGQPAPSLLSAPLRAILECVALAMGEERVTATASAWEAEGDKLGAARLCWLGRTLAGAPAVLAGTRAGHLVVGAGPTGVEFAAELDDHIREDLGQLYPKEVRSGPPCPFTSMKARLTCASACPCAAASPYSRRASA